MAKFNLVDQTYRGYTLSFKVNRGTWKSQIMLTFQKNGKSLTYSKTFDDNDTPSDIYNALVQEAKTVIDYIEYQVEQSVERVKLSLQNADLSFERRDAGYKSEDKQMKPQKDDLESWFENTDTSRFLKEIGDNKNA